MYRHILLLLLLVSSSVMAAELICSGYTQIGGTYTLPHSGQKITPPDTGNAGATGGGCSSQNCKILFIAQNSIIGGRPIYTQNCTPAHGISGIKTGYTVTDIPAGNIYELGGYRIYPTSVKGIGVSINESANLSAVIYPKWPDAIWRYSTASSSDQKDVWVDIRVWKTPEFTAQTGSLSFTGPKFMMVVSPNSSVDTISSCPNNTAEGRLDERTCVWFSRVLKGSINFQSGTCNLAISSRIVALGDYGVNVGKSPWKDSSFQLQCPTAYGYNSAVVNSVNKYDVEDGAKIANQTKNNSVKIQVVPYNSVINAAQGIFSLDAGGAQGYGIQLAWGMPGEQTASDIPTKPVVFGSRTLAGSLNSNFINGPYNYGGNALATGADGTIKMSARYIRTTGNTQPGPANGKVEIIAAYE
jgi:hypothetical protein